MKAYKAQILTLAIVGLVAVTISLTASAPSLSAAPSSNPPSGNVTPTFSGLNVTVDASIGDDLSVGDLLTADRFRVNSGSTVLIGDVGVFGMTTFYNDVSAYADIKSLSGDIGSFYTRTMTTAVTTGAVEIPGVSCYSGDWLSGCSAYYNYDSVNDKYHGAYPTGDRTCRAAVEDDGGTNDTVTVYARCFDPNGARSGTY